MTILYISYLQPSRGDQGPGGDPVRPGAGGCQDHQVSQLMSPLSADQLFTGRIT